MSGHRSVSFHYHTYIYQKGHFTPPNKRSTTKYLLETPRVNPLQPGFTLSKYTTLNRSSGNTIHNECNDTQIFLAHWDPNKMADNFVYAFYNENYYIFTENSLYLVWKKGIEEKATWVRSRKCGCLVTWFCYHLIANPGNKTATPQWPDTYCFRSWLGYNQRTGAKPLSEIMVTPSSLTHICTAQYQCAPI